MKQRMRRPLCILLTLVMLLGLMPGMALTASAAGAYKVTVSAAGLTSKVYYVDSLPAGSPVASSNYGIDASENPYHDAMPALYYKSGTLTSSSNPDVVEVGTGDYAHHYCIKKTGTATISYKGAEPFSTSTVNCQITLTIEANSKAISGCTASASDVTYDGTAHQQPVTVMDGATTLVQGTDYSLTYPTDCTNAGTKTVTVTGMGIYTGTTSASYKINKASGSISYGTASVRKYLAVDGAFTNTLTQVGDGTVSYASNNTAVATVNATTGEVTPVGAGSATITATVTDSDNYAYAVKTATYTVNVWELKMVKVQLDSSKYPVHSGDTISTSDWTVKAYFAAKSTSIPAESDPPFNFDASSDWDVKTLSNTEYTVDGVSGVTSKTVAFGSNTFTVAFCGQSTTVRIPLLPYELTAGSDHGEVKFTIDDPANPGNDIEVSSVDDGRTITITVTPDTGYAIDTVTVKKGSDDVAVTDLTGGKYSFTMPAGNVTATVTYTEKKYALTNAGTTNGSYTFRVNGADVTETTAGSVVTVNVTADAGYVAESIAVTKTEDGSAVESFGNSFVMPDFPVTVGVTIAAEPADDAKTAWNELNTTNYPVGSTLHTGRYYLTADVDYDGSLTGNGLKIQAGAVV